MKLSNLNPVAGLVFLGWSLGRAHRAPILPELLRTILGRRNVFFLFSLTLVSLGVHIGSHHLTDWAMSSLKSPFWNGRNFFVLNVLLQFARYSLWTGVVLGIVLRRFVESDLYQRGIEMGGLDRSESFRALLLATLFLALSMHLVFNAGWTLYYWGLDGFDRESLSYYILRSSQDPLRNTVPAILAAKEITLRVMDFLSYLAPVLTAAFFVLRGSTLLRGMLWGVLGFWVFLIAETLLGLPRDLLFWFLQGTGRVANWQVLGPAAIAYSHALAILLLGVIVQFSRRHFETHRFLIDA